VAAPDDVLVKLVAVPRHAGGALKAATGFGFTVTVCIMLAMQPKLEVAVSVTVNVPEVP
jgi:hypothetical protein